MELLKYFDSNSNTENNQITYDPGEGRGGWVGSHIWRGEERMGGNIIYLKSFNPGS